jgi:hypothetical protein
VRKGPASAPGLPLFSIATQNCFVFFYGALNPLLFFYVLADSRINRVFSFMVKKIARRTASLI